VFIVINPSLTESDKFLTFLEVSGMDPLRAMGVLQVTWSHILRSNPTGDLGKEGLDILREGLSEALSKLYAEPGESLCGVSIDSIPGLLVDSGFLRWDKDSLKAPGWDDWSGRTLLERRKKTQSQARWRKKKKRKAPGSRCLQDDGRGLQNEDGRHLQKTSRHLHPESRHLQLETSLDQRVAGNKAEDKKNGGVSLISKLQLPYKEKTFASFTKEQVEGGDADGLSGSRVMDNPSVREAIAQVHRDVWGSKVSADSTELRKALRTLVIREKRKPSDVCRAVKGMAKDPWKKRKEHNAWRYVVRDIDKWLSLADDESLLKNDNMDWGPWRDEGYETNEEWEKSRSR